MKNLIISSLASVFALLLFSEFSASCFRRISPFLEAWSKTSVTVGEKGWEKVALLSWAFAGIIPLVSFCLACVFFLSPEENKAINDLILGATVGSNIVALGLLFGLILHSGQLSFFRIRTMNSPVFLFLCTIAFVITCLDSKISFGEGLMLWGLAIAYALYFRAFSSEWKYYQRHSNDAATEIASGLLSIISIVFMGFGFLLFAILSAYPFAQTMLLLSSQKKISGVVLGATLVAGTLTFPWLLRVLFNLRSQDTQKAMSISSITHTCLLNILFLPGVLTLFTPLVIPKEFFQIDLPVILFFTGTFVCTLLIEKKEGKSLHSFLLLAYIIYVATGVFRR